MKKRSGEKKILFILMSLVCLSVAGYLFWSLGQQGKFTFAKPWGLLMLLAIPLSYWILFPLGKKRKAVLRYSNTNLLAQLGRGPFAQLTPLPKIFRLVALTLIVLALAHPQTRERGSRIEVEGIDIMLALDLSQSMEAIDLLPNRLEAAKQVVDDFISRRRSDKIGVVVFANEAYTHCPLTLDYSVLRNMLREIRLGLIDGSATAIGNALGVSLARLRKSDAKSKVVILLTDGDNNSGNVTPKQAARYARAMKVKVFTILMGEHGTQGGVTRDFLGRPVRTPQAYPVNPELLEQIAAQTGGKAYLASDQKALRENFEHILDELDKSSRKDIAAVFTHAYKPFVAIALFLLLTELGLFLTRFRQFP
ncbi:MAG: VWA domain-containing protein [Pseudomonadota bacterium]